ncbi:unnamed protein product [Lactuca virosa]|uniref:Uncharacterized protein n=1 Tax=Lactuca virosa TaxID=75947 RepID=A0AAU9LC75_9ASTR|nr:unnamed protein product [Lactuca virosa]
MFAACFGTTTMEGDKIEAATLANSPVDEVSHLALDIGGSLINMVYFSTEREQPVGLIQKRGQFWSQGYFGKTFLI